MWKSKKLIVIAVVAAVVVVGAVAGIAFAQTGTAAAASANNTLMTRVAQILGIDQAKLESAFTQARQEQRDAALDTYLKDQVAKGKITQPQADQYKSWLKARPNVPALGPQGGMPRFGGRGGMMGGGWNFRGAPAPIPAPASKTS